MRGIELLHPELQMVVKRFLQECQNQGLNVLITETLRTQQEQEKLFAQGRTTPGNIVTNCKGYQSPHVWGVAFDFCRNVKGKEYDNTDSFFNNVGEIAKTIFDYTEYDLFWGGDFRSFVDRPHIEMIKYLPQNSTKWLINKYRNPEEFMKSWKIGDDEEMPRYNTVSEMPEWSQPTIQKLINRGFLSGTGTGLDLSLDMVRTFVINDKAGLYGA